MPKLSATAPKPADNTAPNRTAAALRHPDLPNYQKYAVHTAPSPIDGLGVWADEAIPKRKKIGEIRGERISIEEARLRASRIERVMIVELSNQTAIDFALSTDPMRYTNHSCQPNARLHLQQGRVEFYSLRDIQVGEEITVDYVESHHEGRLPCQCGAARCRGAI